jgi:hypothetical protein
MHKAKTAALCRSFCKKKRRGKNEKENEELFTYIVTPIYE